MEAILKSKFTQSILESMRAAPVAWAGAAAVALLPFVVLALSTLPQAAP